MAGGAARYPYQPLRRLKVAVLPRLASSRRPPRWRTEFPCSSCLWPRSRRSRCWRCPPPPWPRRPSASISKSCGVSKKPRALGPTYTLGLSVKGTSCANGRGFVRAYYKCRGGGKGRCRRKVSGYRCSEKRSNVIRTQFDARVTCKKGGRRITTSTRSSRRAAPHGLRVQRAPAPGSPPGSRAPRRGPAARAAGPPARPSRPRPPASRTPGPPSSSRRIRLAGSPPPPGTGRAIVAHTWQPWGPTFAAAARSAALSARRWRSGVSLVNRLNTSTEPAGTSAPPQHLHPLGQRACPCARRC